MQMWPGETGRCLTPKPEFLCLLDSDMISIWYRMAYARHEVQILEGGKNICPIVPFFLFPSPAKDEVSLEHKILEIGPERPTGMQVDGEAGDGFCSILS